MATTNHIITAREQAEMLSPWLVEREASMPVTLYTKPDCPQCVMTKKRLDAHGIEHNVVDLTQDPEAYEHVTKNLGYSAAPVVEHANGHWSGFRPDHIRALAG